MYLSSDEKNNVYIFIFSFIKSPASITTAVAVGMSGALTCTSASTP